MGNLVGSYLAVRPVSTDDPRLFLSDLPDAGPRQPEAEALYLATGYTPLYDPELPAEQIGKHPFEKEVSSR